jgi:hypothetical protein
MLQRLQTMVATPAGFEPAIFSLEGADHLPGEPTFLQKLVERHFAVCGHLRLPFVSLMRADTLEVETGAGALSDA